MNWTFPSFTGGTTTTPSATGGTTPGGLAAGALFQTTPSTTTTTTAQPATNVANPENSTQYADLNQQWKAELHKIL